MQDCGFGGFRPVSDGQGNHHDRPVIGLSCRWGFVPAMSVMLSRQDITLHSHAEGLLYRMVGNQPLIVTADRVACYEGA